MARIAGQNTQEKKATQKKSSGDLQKIAFYLNVYWSMWRNYQRPKRNHLEGLEETITKPQIGPCTVSVSSSQSKISQNSWDIRLRSQKNFASVVETKCHSGANQQDWDQVLKRLNYSTGKLNLSKNKIQKYFRTYSTLPKF